MDLSSEIIYKAVRSSGKGGQNVNKVSSKVELYFDVRNSQLLTDDQKSRIFEKGRTYLNLEGILKIASQEDRSQLRNKELVTQKFYEILGRCFHQEKKRKPTKPTFQSKQKRLETKRISGLKKELRRKKFD